ncbi:uncharacterized protein LOC143288875 [Babylonia areolata]|uniref:uncharacterized protein LOC143288875 n=1 Tax=Babylonia areolata TaxID=304850 RepID=UPI003FD4DF5A
MAGEYEKLRLLGSGSYGKAWLVRCRSKKKQAVLKEIKLDSLSDKEMEQALLEVKILAKCRHVNIISYCEAFVSACRLHIVMEFAESGDLQKKIVEQRGIYFKTETILDWFIQICFALKYLHSENILHRDLKPQNLFLTSDGVVKVGDFGIARILQDTGDHAVTAIGTPYYISPEICQRQPYDNKSDMWSAGCVLYELCCLRVPFQAPNLPLLVLNILQGGYDPIPSECGAVLEDLVRVLLNADPSQRPTAQQVLSVPALRPYVSATYRHCLRHKQHRQRPRLPSSREPGSPVLSSPRPRQQSDQSPSSHCTFRVKSPLVRRLSVATPKLKAAIKRQRSVQSAEPAPTRKRHRQGSRPPVFNLQEEVLSLHPGPLPQPPHTQHTERISHRPSSPHIQSKKDCTHNSESDTDADPYGHKFSDSDDDVFEDNKEVPEEDSSCDSSPVFARAGGSGNRMQSSQKRVCNSGTKTEAAGAVSSTAGKKEGRNMIAGTDVRFKMGKAESVPSSLHQRSCTPVKNKHNESIILKAPMALETDVHCNTESKEEQQGPYSRPSPRKQQSPTSDTYTVVSLIKAEGKPICPACGQGRPLQPCLHQALFEATSLSYRNKAAAQRRLSQFLLTHLGSELSLRLCSVVNVALHAGEDYGTLEKHLDDECKSYLPVIFHLLSWGEEVVPKT